MSAITDIISRVFDELINSNVLVRVKGRKNPLVSEYVIKYSNKCPEIKIEDDISIDRESTWYQVLTTGVGVKLSINRVGVSLESVNNTLKLIVKLMNGDRLKSSEEFVLTCDGAEGSFYGKSVIDLLINLDLVFRFLGMIKERRKLSDGFIDDLTKFLGNAKSKVEQDVRRLVSSYQWFDE